jgi:hypothetical protein
LIDKRGSAATKKPHKELTFAAWFELRRIAFINISKAMITEQNHGKDAEIQKISKNSFIFLIFSSYLYRKLQIR